MVTRAEAIARLTAEGTFEIVEDHGAGYPMRAYKNAPPAFRSLLESSRRYDERPFPIYGTEGLSFARHFGKAAALPTSYRVTENDLPRTATGKVLKRELREMFARNAD